MESQDFSELLASLQQIVRQAYSLGRADALKQVVEVLKKEGVPERPLALAGPVEDAAPAAGIGQPEPKPAGVVSFVASNDDLAGAEDDLAMKPWWARQPRKM